jgi:hypothetical protein
MSTDLGGTLNALGLIAVVLATAVMLLFYGGKPTHWLRFPLGAVAFIVAGIFAPLQLHSASAGYQRLFPALCVALLVLFVQRWRPLPIIVFAIGMSWVLTSQAYKLVDYGPYPRPPAVWTRIDADHRIERLVTVTQTLSKIADSHSYPAGWLTDSPLAARISSTALRPGYVGESYALWHSALTGLYLKHGVHVELWYPGGPLAQAMPGIQFRERPTP